MKSDELKTDNELILADLNINLIDEIEKLKFENQLLKMKLDNVKGNYNELAKSNLELKNQLKIYIKDCI